MHLQDSNEKFGIMVHVNVEKQKKFRMKKKIPEHNAFIAINKRVA